MTNTNNDIEELEELLTELEGQEAQLVAPYSEDDDAVTQLMDAPLSDQEWMVQVTALDRRMMSTDQLQSEIQAGKISSRTLVWRSGMDDWLPVSRVDELARANRPGSSPMASSLNMPMSLPPPPAMPLSPIPSSSPRASLGQLPPPPAPLPPQSSPAWSNVSPMANTAAVSLPPPPAVPSQASSSSVNLPKPVALPPAAAETVRARANTTRPVAVDFSDIAEEAPAPMRGKRLIMGISAAAVVAAFAGVLALSSGEEKANASAPAAKPQAVASLQPAPATAPAKVNPPAAQPEKTPEPQPEPAPVAPEPEAPAVETAPSRQTAPARYAMRSEYKRRSRASAASESSSSDDAEPAASSAKPTAPEAPASAEPEEEDAPATTADDDADAEQAPKSGKSGNTFNREAAKAALDSAAAQAKNCRPQGGPSGSGRVQVRYEPSGKVAAVSILTSKFENTDAGSCVRMVFRRARVPEFTGATGMVVNKSFEIP
jgi:hypothetical protein